jgi:putative membrane protein
MALVQILPAVNATLNATSGICLLIAFALIKRRRVQAHKRFMLAACATSLLFLALYVTNHYLRHGVVTRFTGVGVIRPIYFTILITHTTLAIVIVPLVIITLRYGLRMRVAQHRRIARWTFPLWMYVSVTGVLVYFFLYQWFPSTS